MAWAAGYQYVVLSSATDVAGNVQNALTPGISSVTFTYELNVPTATITYPGAGARSRNLPAIVGTAALAAPDTIKNVQVRILDQTSVNKQY